MTNALFWLVPISSVLALLFAWYFYKQLMKTDEGTPQMKKIALYILCGVTALFTSAIQGRGFGVFSSGDIVFYHGVRFWSPEQMGSGGVSHGRFFLRLIGVFGNEDSHLRICSNG